MRKHNKTFHIRFTEREYEKLCAMSERTGLPKSTCIRFLIAGLVPKDRPSPDYYAMTKHNAGGHVKNDWDESILQIFDTKVDVLFTYDFPNCDSLSNLKADSLDFLGLSPGWTTVTLKKAFVKCSAYRWLRFVLEQKENNEIYFGELSALIHDVIINDPKPYRKEVKELQSNLINWIIELDIEEMQIDRPKHSQRIKLLQQQKYSIMA